jgi:hypothetical protein
MPVGKGLDSRQPIETFLAGFSGFSVEGKRLCWLASEGTGERRLEEIGSRNHILCRLGQDQGRHASPLRTFA